MRATAAAASADAPGPGPRSCGGQSRWTNASGCPSGIADADRGPLHGAVRASRRSPSPSGARPAPRDPASRRRGAAGARPRPPAGRARRRSSAACRPRNCSRVAGPVPVGLDDATRPSTLAVEPAGRRGVAGAEDDVIDPRDPWSAGRHLCRHADAQRRQRGRRERPRARAREPLIGRVYPARSRCYGLGGARQRSVRPAALRVGRRRGAPSSCACCARWRASTAWQRAMPVALGRGHRDQRRQRRPGGRPASPDRRVGRACSPIPSRSKSVAEGRGGAPADADVAVGRAGRSARAMPSGRTTKASAALCASVRSNGSSPAHVPAATRAKAASTSAGAVFRAARTPATSASPRHRSVCRSRCWSSGTTSSPAASSADDVSAASSGDWRSSRAMTSSRRCAAHPGRVTAPAPRSVRAASRSRPARARAGWWPAPRRAACGRRRA